MNNLDDGAALEWRDLYEAAVLELDHRRLPERIEEARQAILQCLECTNPADQILTEALNNALLVLQDLYRISAGDGKTDVA